MRIWNNVTIKCPVCRSEQPAHFGSKLPQTNHALMKLIQIEQAKRRKAKIIEKV
jgi:hypothetical protein